MKVRITRVGIENALNGLHNIVKFQKTEMGPACTICFPEFIELEATPVEEESGHEWGDREGPKSCCNYHCKKCGRGCLVQEDVHFPCKPECPFDESYKYREDKPKELKRLYDYSAYRDGAVSNFLGGIDQELDQIYAAINEMSKK